MLKSGRGRKTIKLHVTDKTQAERLVKELDIARVERMSVAGTISRDLVRQMTRGEGVSVALAIERWSAWLRSTSESGNTADNMTTYALAWMRESRSSKMNIDAIVEDDIDRWVNQSDGCKANTRRFRLAVMRSLFTFCSAKSYREDDPSKLIRVKMKDLSHEQKEVRSKRIFTDEEFAKLDSYIRNNLPRIWDRQRCAFWLSAIHIGRHSALRLGDIASLQYASIGERFVVHTDKRNTRVEQEITPELRVALNLIPKRINSDWCFPRQAVIDRTPRYRSSLSVDFGRILKKAGVHNHTFHELRSSKITELVNQGKTVEFAARFAGHSDTRTTETYIVKPTTLEQTHERSQA